MGLRGPPHAAHELCVLSAVASMRWQDAEAVCARLAIEDKLLLRASQPWVEAPSALLLPSGGRSFEVKARSSILRFIPSCPLHLQHHTIMLLMNACV